jgi:hypothetical protein
MTRNTTTEIASLLATKGSFKKMLNLAIAIKLQGRLICPTCERELTTMPYNPNIILCMACQIIYRT